MNWDWDKLKEKQKSQQSWNPFPKNDDENKLSSNKKQQENNEKSSSNDEPIDFRELYKKANNNNNGGGGNNGNGGNRSNRSKSPQNPFGNLPEFSGGKAFKFAAVGLVGIWLLSGIYIIQPDEAGVVLRFGEYEKTTDAGPHYHLPFPIERVYKPKVTQIRQADIGFRSQSNNYNFQQGRSQNIEDEAAMLTGDENIVNIQFSVQYRIKPEGAVDYLFNVTDPDAVLKNAAEAAMREVIGNNNIDAALTDGKVQIQNDVLVLLQSILDKYKVGLDVVSVQMQDVQPPQEVSDAFKDVASAREDKSRIINEAEAYRNALIPIARGDAAEIVYQAEAYKQTRIRNAEGEASRFLSILDEYKKSPEITKERLTYEALENILSQPGLDKIVVSDNMSNMMPIIPMNPTTAGQVNNAPQNLVPQSGVNLQNQYSGQNSLRPDPYAQSR